MNQSTTVQPTSARWLRVHPRDNVIVALTQLPAGEVTEDVTTTGPVGPGHKIAVTPIKQGEHVIKYGYSIGLATRDIQPGDFVHSHNLASGLDANLEYQWQRDDSIVAPAKTSPATFQGYRRADGRAAIRIRVV